MSTKLVDKYSQVFLKEKIFIKKSIKTIEYIFLIISLPQLF